MSTKELERWLQDWRARNQNIVQDVSAAGDDAFKITLKQTPRGGNLPFIDVYARPDNKVVLQKGMYKGSTPGTTFIKGPRFLRDETQLDDSLKALLK